MAELTPDQLADALHELGEIDNELSRIASYTMLRKAVDVTSEQNRDLGAAVDAAIVQARNALRFFELEWLALDDERAGELIAAPEVAADRHYLTAQRRYRDHVLSEPEERALGERDPAAVSAWQTLYAPDHVHHRGAVRRGRRPAAAHHRPAARPTCTTPAATCDWRRWTRSTPRWRRRRPCWPTATTRWSPTGS